MQVRLGFYRITAFTDQVFPGILFMLLMCRVTFWIEFSVNLFRWKWDKRDWFRWKWDKRDLFQWKWDKRDLFQWKWDKRDLFQWKWDKRDWSSFNSSWLLAYEAWRTCTGRTKLIKSMHAIIDWSAKFLNLSKILALFSATELQFNKQS